MNKRIFFSLLALTAMGNVIAKDKPAPDKSAVKNAKDTIKELVEHRSDLAQKTADTVASALEDIAKRSEAPDAEFLRALAKDTKDIAELMGDAKKKMTASRENWEKTFENVSEKQKALLQNAEKLTNKTTESKSTESKTKAKRKSSY